MLAAFSLFFVLLASQVSAFTFNVSFGTPAEPLTADKLLPTAFPKPIDGCQSNCSSTQTALAACNNDAGCLCAGPLVAQLLNCEQCMFQSLINANAPLPDPKAGSTPMLAGYQTACAAFNITNVTKADISLVLPSTWDGPFGQGLNTVETVISVGAAFILGMSSLLIVSNL
ncbi:hypothetical protein GYMLUDRAFT_264499 [Collybiopsis luxurians FD-317 M1]|uniref:Extracellular membrane protein CFEM domain-containing protein n=1 Tax=Collybiopsis luxurians FD-317 M1 TaxID=944289 RepID=A0A0D0BIJ4_9AGAR|nr:hypothetical protein GYMLUDRAFT_264499 [Collybiopsis luxurians FD-317 M1]